VFLVGKKSARLFRGLCDGQQIFTFMLGSMANSTVIPTLILQFYFLIILIGMSANSLLPALESTG